MAHDTNRLALLGAGGTMGFAMARNLARAGFEVRAWNRTRERADPLAEDGATIAATPAEAAEGADVVITMLSDTDAVLAAMEGEAGALAGRRPGHRVAADEHGGPGRHRALRRAGRRPRGGLRGRPGSGHQGAGRAGQARGPGLRALTSFATGFSRSSTPWPSGRCGWARPAAGTRLKLVANSWILSVVEGTAETVALAEGLGLDPALFFEAVEGGALDLPYLRNKGAAMVARNFEPSFRLALAAKDAGLVEEAAERHGLDLPMLAAVRRRLEEGVPEHGDKDMSATFLSSVPSD